MVNTLSNLGQIRQYATFLLEQDGAGTSDFWTNEILDAFIYAEHKKLVTQINHAYEEFFTAQATTDITTSETYGLPADFRTLLRLEYNGQPTSASSEWTEIEPIQLNEAPDFVVPGGISPTTSGRATHRVTYHFLADSIRLVPHFNLGVTDGLRMFYIYRLPDPVDDAWVPFSVDGVTSLLADHHELIAVGAVIRGKMREEVDHLRYVHLYQDLYRQLLADVETRQAQRSKHVRRTEKMYDV